MTERKNRPWLYLILAVIVIGLDQLSKWLVVAYLEPVGSLKLIPDFLHLTYLENEGAAFGTLSDHRWVFMISSTVAIVALGVYLFRFAENNRLLRWALAFVLGGGIGNMIDRIALGYVIDFIDFCGIWRYIFNVADSFVCIGMGMLALYVLLTIRNELKGNKQAHSADVQDDGGQS